MFFIFLHFLGLGGIAASVAVGLILLLPIVNVFIHLEVNYISYSITSDETTKKRSTCCQQQAFRGRGGAAFSNGLYSTLVPFRFHSEREHETRRFAAVYCSSSGCLVLAALGALAVAFAQRRRAQLPEITGFEGFLLAAGPMMFLALAKMCQVEI